MNRREFIHTAAAGVVAASTQMAALAEKKEQQEPPAGGTTIAKRAVPKLGSPKKSNLKLGTQHGDSDDILSVMAAFGVNHICAEPPSQEKDEWSTAALSRKREHIESFGLQVEALPLLHPATITKSEIPNVMMGKSPERDREIDVICEKIGSSAKAGFPMLPYTLSILGLVPTTPTPRLAGPPYSHL